MDEEIDAIAQAMRAKWADLLTDLDKIWRDLARAGFGGVVNDEAEIDAIARAIEAQYYEPGGRSLDKRWPDFARAGRAARDKYKAEQQACDQPDPFVEAMVKEYENSGG
jgi:hypothetical protein